MGLTRIRAEQISDIDYKQAVRVITLSDVTLSGGAPATVDGVNLSTGNRVLVAGQSTGSQNGLYIVQTVGAGSNGTWIRSSDGNADGEIEAGMIVMVTEGDSYKDTQWKLTTNDPIIIGTTPLVFEQNSAYAFGNIYANGTAVLANSVGDTVTFTAGDNIEITGNNTSKTVIIGVTGISLNSIANGTSNVAVVSSGGNVTVGVAGSEVAKFSAGGIDVTGNILPTANITYDLGSNTQRWNDLYLANSTIYLGNAQISANTTAIIITNPAGGQTVLSGATPEVSAETVTATGNVVGGNLITTGAVSATGNITGGNILTVGLISATGNVTGGNLSIANNVTISGNLSVTGNATLSGNILGDRIQNGSTSIDIQTPSGNANISIGGTSNVAVFSTAGANITGALGVTGNITGSNILGNGASLTGINSFSTVSVTGGNSATADSIADTLTLTAGSGISLVMDTSTDTLTIAATGGSEIFVDGADFGTVTEPVTLSDNLGLVTDLVDSEADLGTIVTSGVFYPDLLVIESPDDFLFLGGNNGQYLGTTGNGVLQWQNISAALAGTMIGNIDGNTFSINNLTSLGATGNITGGNLVTVGQVTATGNITGSFIFGNGSQLTGIDATGIQSGTSNVRVISSGGNVATGIGGTSNVVIVATTGQFVTGLISATGNVTGGNLVTAGNTTISTSLAVGATTPSGTAGEIRATNAITAFYSDRRLKTNIQQIQHALDKVEQLSGVVYTQNKLAETFGYNDYSQQVGVFAQDVKEVQPEAVKLAPFDLDENGQSKSGENYLTVQYEKLVPLLIESIKELRKEINLIKNQLDSKGNNSANNS